MSSLWFFLRQRKGFSAAVCRRLGCESVRIPRRVLAAVGSASLSSEARASDVAEVGTSNLRTSALGIQMISKPLHEQIFCGEPTVSKDAVDKSKRHLKSHGLNAQPNSTNLPDIDVDLPPLLGADINEHFVKIAEQQTQLYLSLASGLADAKLPQMPRKWNFVSGWTRYDGNSATAVPYPDEDALVLDVEVCVRDSERPILATAVSRSNWYSWVSERLVADEDYDIGVQGRASPNDLIPLETEAGHEEPCGGEWRERVVVGHSVSYDRARIKEQYLLKGPRTKFLDTMSLHVCVAGQTAAQKLMWHKHNGKDVSNGGGGGDSWLSVSCPNGLADVHWLHVGSRNGTGHIDKEKRDVFIKGRLQDVRKQFQSLMRYCANDVVATHEVLGAVLPVFLQRCPHPVTLAGMLEMGGAYLPVETSWEKYIADSEYVYEEMEGEMKAKLMALADNACTYMHRERYRQSPWLCNLDWSSKKFRGKEKKTDMKRLLGQLEEHYEQREREFRVGGGWQQGGGGGVKGREEEEGEGRVDFFISGDGRTKRAVHMPGYPEWYRNLCMRRSAEQWCPGAVLVSAQTRVAPYLLRMKWKGFPLHYHTHLGWGYIVPPELRPGEVPEWDQEEDVGVQAMESEVNSDQLPYGDLVDNEEEGALVGIDIESGADALKEIFDQDSATVCVRGSDINRRGSMADRQVEGRMEGAVREEEGEWRPERVETQFGRTDDIVNLINGKTYYFFKLPHKDGAGSNVGNPLAKSYLHQMESGTLTSAAGHLGRRIFTLNSMMSFWRSARQRVLEQFVVWNDKKVSNDDSQRDRQGVILPQLAVAGTVTRRAVEPTWLTASNAKETRVGSELKAMVRAPEGYHFVGADVDSQELWIASVLGDMHFAGMHGSTAIGWMTLQGNKAEGTDVHSKTASTIGITRDQAKILNYGRIYGAGRPFIELLLKQFNPILTGKEVAEKARTLLEATKGRRLYRLTEQGCKMVEYCGVDVGPQRYIPADSSGVRGVRWVSRYRLTEQGCKMVEYCGVDVGPQRYIPADSSGVRGVRWVSRYTEGRIWEGGSESDLFNKLESIALSAQPTTPVLGCLISRALETRHTQHSFTPSKVNWVVQSSAVDYLHLILVATKWLADAYNIDGRFCISIHDEVRYLVKSDDRYRFALALQYANLLTRAMFSHRLNLHDLPMSVAFFSAVDIDKCLRKEATMDCLTPSNPLGLEKGHDIPQGEVLDIYEILEKTGSSLER